MASIIGASGVAAATTPLATTIANSSASASMLAFATMSLSSNKYILGLMIFLINLGAR